MSIAEATTTRIGRSGIAAWLSAVLGCVLVLAAAVALTVTVRPLGDRASHEVGQVFMALGTQRQVVTWKGRGRPPGGLSGVVFGDSVFAPMTAKTGFVGTLEPALRTVGLDVNLLNLTQPGFGAFQFYYLVDATIAAGPPDFAVVEVNLRTFAPDWYLDAEQRFAALATGLSPARVWRLHRALATQQVGLLTPLQYRLQVDSGMFLLIGGSRSAGLAALEQVGSAANQALGLSVRSSDELMHEALGRHVLLTPEHAKAWYGQNFVASPVAEVMAAVSADLRAVGVKTLFMLAPVQRRRLRMLGIAPAEMRARTEALREMLGASPEDWIDATELFQSSDFLDGMHVERERIRRMVRPVADRLVAIFGTRAGAASPDTLAVAPSAP